MKPSCHTGRTRALAIAVFCDGRSVYADPLSGALFGSTPPIIPEGQERGCLITGEHPYLAFRRAFSLAGTPYTLYAALPVSASEASDPAALALLAMQEMDALADRFALVLRETERGASLSSVPILYYYRTLCDDVCRTLYAPLVTELDGQIGEGAVRVHRAALSQAIGLSLAALLRIGQSTLKMRLSSADGGYVLSLVGETGFDNPFLYHLLEALAACGGFTVRRDACGLSFLLTAARTPAVMLRDEMAKDEAHLFEGFFLL